MVDDEPQVSHIPRCFVVGNGDTLEMDINQTNKAGFSRLICLIKNNRLIV